MAKLIDFSQLCSGPLNIGRPWARAQLAHGQMRTDTSKNPGIRTYNFASQPD